MNAKFQRPRIQDNATDEYSGVDFVQTRSAESDYRSGWRWVDLTLSLGLAGLLGYTWIWPRGRAVWNQVDATLFRFCNGALNFEWSRKGWAYLNHNYCDWVGVVLYGLLILYAGRFGRRSLRRSAISFALLAVVVLGISGTARMAVKFGNGAFNRPSPSLANPDCHRLTSMFEAMPMKDASPWCFPSDHGFVVLAIALYLGYRGPDRAVKLSLLLGLVFIVPRLVSGAHWFTDYAIGSTIFALVSTSLLMATPLHDWLLDRIDRGGASIRSRATSRAAQMAAAVADTATRPIRRRAASAVSQSGS